VAAGLVGRCATEETLDAWIALARRVPIRELRARVTAAVGPGEGGTMDGPAAVLSEMRSGAQSTERAGNEEPEVPDDLAQVILRVPRPLREAFEEAHRLHEVVEGCPTDRASFVEALVGEVSAGLDAPEVPPPEPRSRHRAWDRARIERYLADISGCWRSLDAPGCASEGPEADLARAVLHRARFLRRHAGEGDAVELDTQLRALIALENDLERALGSLLAHMAERRAWSALRFSGVGHYGEQRLGMSRASAESRAWIARTVSRSPALKASYESGRLGHEAALLLGRLFAEVSPEPQEKAAWVEHAEAITIRRLRDEVGRAMALIDEPRSASSTVRELDPNDDPGHAVSVAGNLDPIEGSCHAGSGGGDLCPIEGSCHAGSGGGDLCPIEGSCHAGLVGGDLGPIEGCCHAGSVGGDLGRSDEAHDAGSMAPDLEPSKRLCPASLVPTDAEWRSFLVRVPGRSRERVRRLCALAGATPDVFPGRGKAMVALRLRLPRDLAAAFQALVAYRGLASILLEFVEVWDATPPRASDRVYIRDGWRCTAPGCSSRRNLEDHHIRYRSRGGDNSLGNRTCLCRFHHRQGEHGGLMRVTGTAPLGMKWVSRMGVFQNDRAI
jgi:hypothetical protein